MRRAAGLASALLGYVLLTLPSHAQQEPLPTYRAGVDLLQIDVSVLDKSRHPVIGLSASDFDVRVDGQRRPIVAFKAIEVPPPPPEPTARWMREVAPDVTNNAPISGRVVVIVMDDYTMGEAALGPDSVQEARRIALATLDELGPFDRAAVMFTSYNHKAQTFTRDRALLKQAIAGLAVFPETMPADEQGFCYCGVCPMEALANVAQALAALPEQRKIVVYVSAGSVVPVPDLAYNPAPGETMKDQCIRRRALATHDALRHLNLANVTIEAFDPKGLDLGSSNMGARRGTMPTPIVSPNQNPSLLRLDFLKTMAESTGGRAVVNNNYANRQVPAMLAESSAYYLLGVEMPPPNRGGRLHPIQVRVNRRDVEVRTRKGVFDPNPSSKSAPAADATDAALAIKGVAPASGFPLEVVAAPFATADGRAELVVVTSIAPPADRASGPWPRSEQVDIVAGLLRPETGDRAGELRERLSATWAQPDPRFRNYEVLSGLPAAPGRYELRVGVSTQDGHAASVYTSVEVPDFGNELSASNLILSATPSPVRGSDQQVAGLLPQPPTARRTFRRSDEVTALLRVYQRSREFARVSISSRLTNDKDEVVASDAQALEGHVLGSRSFGDYEIDLPISQLPAGEYLLTVEAKLDKRSIPRQLRFRVE